MTVKQLVTFDPNSLMELHANIQRVTAVMSKMLVRRQRVLARLRSGETCDLAAELDAEDQELDALVADLSYNRSN